MTTQELIQRALAEATEAEVTLHTLMARPAKDAAVLLADTVPLAQVHATLAEAYARMASAQVVLQASEAAQEANRIASVQGIPGARA